MMKTLWVVSLWFLVAFTLSISAVAQHALLYEDEYESIELDAIQSASAPRQPRRRNECSTWSTAGLVNVAAAKEQRPRSQCHRSVRPEPATTIERLGRPRDASQPPIWKSSNAKSVPARATSISVKQPGANGAAPISTTATVSTLGTAT